jgi:hypothetical protein
MRPSEIGFLFLALNGFEVANVPNNSLVKWTLYARVQNLEDCSNMSGESCLDLRQKLT